MHRCLLALLLVIPACSPVRAPKAPAPPRQTYLQAVMLMCDVDRLAGLRAGADPLAVGGLRAVWLAERVDNPDAIDLRTMLSVKGVADQSNMLREAAKQVGMERCALADSLDEAGAGGLSL